MRRCFAWSILGTLAVLAALFLGKGQWGARNSNGRVPARLAVDPPSQRILGSETGGKVTASFRISNRGSGAISLGDTSTSCGCTVATVAPKRLLSGQSSVVTVEATAPFAGEREVSIEIKTDAPTQPVVAHRITLVGNGKAPYVAYHSEAVAFGALDQGTALSESVFLETREVAGEPRWVAEARSTVPYASVSGGLVKEEVMGSAILFRRYVYKVDLQPEAPPGDFSGSIRFFSSVPGHDAVFELPVHGTVRPPVYAIPSSLYVSLVPGKEPPKLKVLIRSAENGADLEVNWKPAARHLFDVRKVESSTHSTSFEVDVSRVPSRREREELVFSTNHRSFPEVRVPVMVRSGD